QVVEIAKELVEAMVGRQEDVLVAEVVLAKLARRVAVSLEYFGNRDIAVLYTQVSPGNTHLGEPGAQARLPGDKRRAAGSATLVTVVVGEPYALVSNTIDVGRVITHDAIAVGTDIGDPDVITPDHQDIGFIS